MSHSIADVGVATETAAADQPGSPLRATDPAAIGDFRVLRLLGEGGMGTVYLGESLTGRPVAIKVIRPEYAKVPEFRERFRRETTHARQVAGFCTAEVLDADPDAEFPYLVTEFVPGPTLSKAVMAGGPLSPADLERLGIGVASALTAIHAAGIAHHDLTPSNVLLHPAGPRVIDFGIANALGTTAPVDDDAAWIGTPGYMAPEQAHSDQIGAAADVFAWAGVMVFAATGRPPFGDGAPEALLHRTLHEEPDLSGLPAGMIDMVRRAFQKDPDARPTAGEVLLGLLGGTGDDSAPAVARALDGWRAPTVRPVGEAEADPMIHDSTAVADSPTPPGTRPRPGVVGPVARPDAPLNVGGLDSPSPPSPPSPPSTSKAPDAPDAPDAPGTTGTTGTTGALNSSDALDALEALSTPDTSGGHGAPGADPDQPSTRRPARRPGPTADRRSGRRRRAAVLATAAALLALIATAVPIAMGADREQTYLSKSIGAGAGWLPAVSPPPPNQPGGGGTASGIDVSPEPASEALTPPPDETAAIVAGSAGRASAPPAASSASPPRGTASGPAARVPAPREAVPSTSGTVPRPPGTPPTVTTITPGPAAASSATADPDRPRTFSRPGRDGTPFSRDNRYSRYQRNRYERNRYELERYDRETWFTRNAPATGGWD